MSFLIDKKYYNWGQQNVIENNRLLRLFLERLFSIICCLSIA